MKRLLLLLLLAGFAATAQTLKVTKITPLGADKFTATLELRNETGQKVRYLSTYCSKTGFYKTNSQNVKVTPKTCGKNYPVLEKIMPRNYQVINLDLEMAANAPKSKFRIGLKFTEIPEHLTMADSASINTITLWSNEIEFKGR